MITALHLPSASAREIRGHAEETYPSECCGFLVGREQQLHSPEREIVRVLRATNQLTTGREHRYAIPPDEIEAVERDLESKAEFVAGFYHSHPDHPARPSEFDRDHAWPWYAYIVLSVEQGRSNVLGAFELDPEGGEFRPIPLRPAEGVEFDHRASQKRTAIRTPERG